ncbi:MAG: MiaB/RimO family radical SAM methylthiotransferase [Candidatus Dojkabacteria bacterium]|nr:MiaB/RimO family radical SAM methylthiotransferase [Candidatus Dojkabacteria bacterium]
MSYLKTFYVKTYGCQMNHSDTERITTVLTSLGLKPTEKLNGADLIVFNTCSVRQSAEDRIFGLKKNISKMRAERNQKIRLGGINSQITNYKLPVTLITGCMCKRSWDSQIPQIKHEEKLYRKKLQKRLPWADIILPIHDISKLRQILDYQSSNHTNHPTIQPSRATGGCAFDANYLDTSPTYKSSYSASIPISTGCDEFCTYCIVPKARGKQSDRSASDVILEIKNLISKGYKDIFLLGQSVNSWKNPEKKYPRTFTELLKEIDSIEGDFWLSFLSSHPRYFGADLINYIASSVDNGTRATSSGKPLCRNDHIRPYLNLALQSGSDKILKRMNRKYTSEEFVQIASEMREKIPNLNLSTDIIVGFPEETEKDFEHTLKVMEKVQLDMAYINKYSAREGTASSLKEETVSWTKKELRDKEANEVLKKTAAVRNKSYIGSRTRVLISKTHESERTAFGKTFNFKDINISLPQNTIIKPGSFVDVKIHAASGWSLRGQLID